MITTKTNEGPMNNAAQRTHHESHLAPTDYTALIRTLNHSESTLAVIQLRRQQSHPPATVLIVDSGSTADDVARMKSASVDFIDNSHRPFNYSNAINTGLQQVKTSYTLIISSHVYLDDANTVATLLHEMQGHDCACGYLLKSDGDNQSAQVITSKNFNSVNGIYNACALIPTQLGLARPFREEVFACEDQEWSKWLLDSHGGKILRKPIDSFRYLNKRANSTKRINEELALAKYVDPSRGGIKSVLKWYGRALKSLMKLNISSAQERMITANRLALLPLGKKPHH
jgi:glycosyltransferase involved in cell wall biosynthesis